ncbi:MAG: TolC family protein, partial [Muribaculaceae bacterium]|nr:TolC family protein [Muribaculaceae bacterium]
FDGFSVGIGLPLYSRRHSSEASDARSLMAENRMRQMETELATGLRTDYIAAESLAAQMREMGPAVENSDNLRLLRRALEGGELSLLDYLQEVNFFREALLDYNALRRSYLLRIASLARH